MAHVAGILLDRLKEAPVKTVMEKYGVDQAEKVREDQLINIQSSLMKFYNSRLNHVKEVNQWLRDVRNVIFSLEDFIDTVLLENSQARDKKPRRLKYVIERMCRKTKKSRDRLNEINTKIMDLSRSGNRLQFVDSQVQSGQPTNPLVFCDDTKSLGLEEARDKIVQQLLDRSTLSRSVVAIVGPGGIGKTNLAKEVYHENAVEMAFPLRIFVSFSQQHDMLRVFSVIAKCLNIPEPTGLSKKHLSDLYSSLTRKKYLIVLDDIWTANLWGQLMGAIPPDEKNGSRVLMTTRIKRVAEEADPACKIYELREQSAEYDRRLFFRWAECSSDPLNLSYDGKKTDTEPYLGYTHSSDDEPEDLIHLVRRCLQEQPLVFQLCLMSVADFPEDYKIDTKSLPRLWMAEDLIQPEDPKPMEDVAEVVLVELEHRSLLRVEKRADGSIKSCRLHDSIKEILRKEVKEYKFLSKPNRRCQLCTESEPARSRLFEELGARNKLRVRYLELHWKWDAERQRCFEELIDGMNSLQTLDLRAGEHGDLPDCIWQVKTLRHVLLSGYSSGPPSWANLKDLQTLTGITNRESWVAGVPDLPSLRVLDIRLYRGFHGGRLASFVDGMKHLVSLKIVSEDIPLKVIDMRSYQCYQYLQSLCLREYRACSNNITLSFDMFPTSLIELTLENFRLQHDPMQVLEKLHCLKRLRLGYRAYDNEKMCCLDGGFPQLMQLELIVLEKLEEWDIQKGAMPRLRRLTASCCPLLRVPEGLKYLTALQRLSWVFNREIDNEDAIRKNIDEHDRDVHIYTYNGA